MTRLVAECPPLDANSAYCNLLQCSHFAETCVAAVEGGRMVGWLSAHRPPSAPDQVFVWQVAVHPSARGAGLGRRMLEALLARPAAADARALTASITEANAASWALFTAFARSRGARLSRAPLFDSQAHFDGRHETEHLVSIDLQAGGVSRPTHEEIR